MKPYYQDNLRTIYCGDCREILPQLKADCCVTDPPYGLEFMGKEWDRLFRKDRHVSYPSCRPKHGPNEYRAGIQAQQFHQEWASALLQCLKPGAMVLSFGGTRTFHRLTCGLEDAGFEIRDCLMWLYGSGFPKSHDISKAIDKMKGVERQVSRVLPSSRQTKGNLGFQMTEKLETIPITPEAQLWNGYGTALKPAWEPIILAMKPLDGTFAENALKYGVAGLNIDDSRIEGEIKSGFIKSRTRGGTLYDKKQEDFGGSNVNFMASKFTEYDVSKGRWPANLLLDEESARMLDEQSGKSVSKPRTPSAKHHRGKVTTFQRGSETSNHSDYGGASRFFYVAKASPKERVDGNNHPTLKPLKLMEYLVKLVAPPQDAILIDPFMGSGTTLLACAKLGIRCIGIDTEKEYCDIAVRRCRQMVMDLGP